MTMSEQHLSMYSQRTFVRTLSLFILPLLTFICCFTASAGEGDIQISLQETEWRWEENTSAVFSGTVSASSLPEKVLMKLSVSTVPETGETGEAVFQNVNGKKLTIRKQKPEYTLNAEGLTEYDFTGIWNTPDSVLFTRVDILLQLWSADGSSLLGEQTLSVSRDTSEVVEKDDGRIRLRENFSGWTLYIAVAAAAVWALALIRILINRRNMRQKR